MSPASAAPQHGGEHEGGGGGHAGGGGGRPNGAAAALAALLEEGALPNLRILVLDDNQIGDDGVAALASALRGGALPSCTDIFLGGIDAPMKEALASPERAAALARRRDEPSA